MAAEKINLRVLATYILLSVLGLIALIGASAGLKAALFIGFCWFALLERKGYWLLALLSFTAYAVALIYFPSYLMLGALLLLALPGLFLPGKAPCRTSQPNDWNFFEMGRSN
jgi:hypothetical protein